MTTRPEGSTDLSRPVEPPQAPSTDHLAADRSVARPAPSWSTTVSQLLLLRHPAAWDPVESSALVRRTAVLLGGSIAVLTAAGVLARLGVPFLSVFDLDKEFRVASLFSAGVLVLAMLATFGAVRSGAGRSLGPVGVFFGFMAVDEFFSLHERVEELLGVDWQVLYLPVFALAGALALVALHRHRRERPFVTLWVAGGAAWLVSQVLERLQWDGDTKLPGYSVMMVVEEVLEMAGSACFVLAMLVLTTRGLQARARRADAS